MVCIWKLSLREEESTEPDHEMKSTSNDKSHTGINKEGFKESEAKVKVLRRREDVKSCCCANAKEAY